MINFPFLKDQNSVKNEERKPIFVVQENTMYSDLPKLSASKTHMKGKDK